MMKKQNFFEMVPSKWLLNTNEMNLRALQNNLEWAL